jgi:hypothetical protein
MHPVILLIALVAALYTLSLYRRAPPARRKKIRDRALLVGGGALLLVLVLRGGLHPLLALLGAAAAIGYRLLGALQLASTVRAQVNQWRNAAAGPSTGQSSDVRTRFVHMTLDHDSGTMTGVVLEGRFEGRRLEDLDLEALRSLYAEASVDQQSRAVLETYLERAHGDAWRASHGANRATVAETTMSEGEARRVLGVTEDATREEIIEAHRRLMQKLHPDRGGSTYLAAQINLAKRTLLND